MCLDVCCADLVKEGFLINVTVLFESHKLIRDWLDTSFQKNINLKIQFCVQNLQIEPSPEADNLLLPLLCGPMPYSQIFHEYAETFSLLSGLFITMPWRLSRNFGNQGSYCHYHLAVDENQGNRNSVSLFVQKVIIVSDL